jgi:addiction module HigA family antidote
MSKVKKNITGWDSPVAIHPGKFLEETLVDFSMSQADLAERINLSKKVVNEIIKGKNPITRATAFKLAKVFSISEEYWVNLQNIYENDKARLEQEEHIEIDKEQHLPNFIETYKELSRIGITSGLRWSTENSSNIVLELQRYFAADSLGYVQKEIEQVYFRKHKHEKEKLNYYTLAAWLRLGKIKAQKTSIQSYDEKKLRNSLVDIARLSQKNPHEYLPKLEEILNECGVVIAYLPYLKKTHVQGAANWIGKDKPLIMINTSNKSEDKLVTF